MDSEISEQEGQQADHAGGGEIQGDLLRFRGLATPAHEAAEPVADFLRHQKQGQQHPHAEGEAPGDDVVAQEVEELVERAEIHDVRTAVAEIAVPTKAAHAAPRAIS